MVSRVCPYDSQGGSTLSGPGAVAPGPDTAWDLLCRECYEPYAGRLQLMLDQPDGPKLVLTPHEWDAFMAGVRSGEFGLT